MAAVLILAATTFAANPFRPAGRGSFSPQANPGDFKVGFWDSRKFDPLTEQPELPPALQMSEYPGDGTGYYLVQFGGPVYSMQIDQLQRAGGKFLGFHSRYLSFVKMNRAVAGKVAALPFVRWVGVYQPGYKLWSRTLASTGFGRVSVVLFYPEDIEAAKRDLAALGLKFVRSGVSKNMKVVEVDCSREQLAAIARLPWVFSIEEWHRPEAENDSCQWVVQDWTKNVRKVWDNGVRGAGEILGYSDEGLNVNHWAFYDASVPITDTGEFPTHRKVVAVKLYPADTSFVWDTAVHGTHVAGTMAGNDSANGGSGRYDGHAKDARIVVLSPIPSPPGNDFTVPLNEITNDLRHPELRPHTIGNSWWTGDLGQYTTASATFDMFSWENRDIQTIKSAGNQYHTQRYTITEPGNAKSIIAATSVQNGTNANLLSSYSSDGPAPDGRIKPDISVPGENIYSAFANSESGYAQMSGTSMASPCVNGCIGLCRSYLRKGYYPSGTATPADTWGYVSSAMLKAMIFVSADPDVESYVVPSVYIGWGRIDLDSVLYFTGDTRKLLAYDDTTGLATGDYRDFDFHVDSTMPLRVGVVWTDTAAAAGANPALINNLDCLLTAPNAGFYKGDLYTNGQSTLNPSGAYNNLDPEEMFRVNQPAAGLWTLRVAAQNVVTRRQPYAVVITGAVTVGNVHDVGVTKVVAPADTVDSGTVVTPTAVVRNFGTYQETFPVRMKIGTTYADSAQVTLAAGALDTVKFTGTWTADTIDTFDLSCFTKLTGDQFPANDTVAVKVVVRTPPGIEDRGTLPRVFALDRAQPTPFSGKTTIRFSIPRTTQTSINIYSATGALVRVLSAPKSLVPRTYSLVWDGRDDRGVAVPRGVYYCRMAAGEFRAIKKLVKLD